MPKDTESTTDHRTIYSVKEVNQHINTLLRESFQKIWIQGEISNLRMAPSGHCYFSIKDDDAVISAVLFKRSISAAMLPFLCDGSKALFFGDISVYEQRGQYQLIVSMMEPLGAGNLFLAFEELKRKLQREGLFASERKKDIPLFPSTVGVVTSPTGAALQDILRVSIQRMPGIDIIVYPVTVQGAEAPEQIIEAIRTANEEQRTEVLIIARGGGSLEDLMAFNDEGVARAIAASKIPTVSGIGHEIDFSIADFVADLRGATPSAAAEMVFPNRTALLDGIASTTIRIQHYTARCLERAQDQVSRYTKTYFRSRIMNGFDRRKMHLDSVSADMESKCRQIIQKRTGRLELLTEKIAALDPKAPFRKGFALVYHGATNALIRSVRDLAKVPDISIHFKDGHADAAVQRIHSKKTR